MTCFVKTSFMYDLLIGTKLIYLQAAVNVTQLKSAIETLETSLTSF